MLTPLFQLIEEAYSAELSPPTLLDGEVEDREEHINHFVGDEKAAQARGYVSSTCMACVTHLVELEGGDAAILQAGREGLGRLCRQLVRIPDTSARVDRIDRTKQLWFNRLRCRRTNGASLSENPYSAWVYVKTQEREIKVRTTEQGLIKPKPP